MSYIQQFFTSRDNNANSETFVGQVGRLWWDPVTNQIYSSDGNTPGGVPLSGGGGNGTPGGSNSQVQFNQAGSFGGSAFLTFNVVTGTLTTVAVSATGNITGGNLSAVNLVINSIRSDDSTFVTIEDGVIVNGVITLENGAIIRDSVDTALAIGFGAGNVTNAQNGALAVGWLAGSEGQGYDAVAIGSSAGGSDGFQGESAIAIGGSAGANLQSPYAVAVGTTAGQFAQGGFSVAIGYGTGLTSQGASAVAIGTGAGNTSQGNATIAVGTGAGSTTQGANAVAIGTGAGTNNQGTSAVAVGAFAGATSQGNNSIILNATAANLDQTTANTFTVAPVRNDVSNIGNVMFYNVTSKEITYGNVISVAGNITGSYFIGNGSLLSSITGANVTGQVSNALVAGTVYTAAQPNITSVGTLTSLSSSGNIDGGNLNAVRLSLSGNVVSAINSTANIITTGNIRAGNLIGSNLTATRIPFVGTGGVITDSIVMYTDQPNQLLYVGGGGAYIGGTGGFGTVNATSHVGSTMTATGNVTGGNIRTGGQVSATGNITGGNVLGGANVNATTHTGTTVSVTGAITGGSLTVSTGNVTLGNIINANGNSVGNIGSSSVYFDTIFAKATSAQYADLAEKYTADAQYASGTVLSFGGAQEVTVTLTDADHRVAGVVSNNPATIMNAGLTGEHVATVALTGRVPCSVTGTVRKGDSMVSAGNGVARAEANPAVSTVIGKALEDFDGESGVIEVAVGVR